MAAQFGKPPFCLREMDAATQQVAIMNTILRSMAYCFSVSMNSARLAYLLSHNAIQFTSTILSTSRTGSRFLLYLDIPNPTRSFGSKKILPGAIV
jgi:hypothetical protein